jgi:uncharacterized lipoprotein YmbA
MKLSFYAQLTLVIALLSGCMLKPVTVSTRHFALAPIPTSESRPFARTGSEQLSVGIGLVKMPSYLLRNSMAVRNGANEVEYLDDALWSERLDESFQRDLAANLADLLPSDSIYLTDWGHDHVMVAVYISVQQFDVDIRGRGTLIAQWRITAPGSDVSLKSGRTRLERTGASPRGKPEVIAETLSELAAQFSRELAQSIREARRS